MTISHILNMLFAKNKTCLVVILKISKHKTEANSFKSCKAEKANSQCNRIAHALHTKDVSKLLCSTHTVRNISLVAKIIKHDRYLELRLEWAKSYRNYTHTGAMRWAKWHEWHLAKQIARVCAGPRTQEVQA